MASWYCPTAQSVHVVGALPALGLYLPVAHWPHELPSGPVYPVLHVQADAALPAVAPWVPELASTTPVHDLHPSEPVTSLNVSAAQATQLTSR